MSGCKWMHATFLSIQNRIQKIANQMVFSATIQTQEIERYIAIDIYFFVFYINDEMLSNKL